MRADRTRTRTPFPRAMAGPSAVAACIALLFALAGTEAVAAEEVSLQGDPFRGRTILSEKRCVWCHSVWGHGGVVGPDLSSAVTGKSWLDLVGDFWNHTPRMIDAMETAGYAWPGLDSGEMTDLLSYLYYLRLFDEPGDAARGEIAFSRLRCVTCHTLAGKGGDVGGPLDRFSAYSASVVLGQAMWNAGPQMQPVQIGTWTAISTFSGRELADIQAYIRARGIREDRQVQLLPLADPSRGARVFREKRCVSCHHPRGEGPDLRASARNMTVSEISGMLWNHSYTMHDWMRARSIPFPQFADSEMADLIAYLYFLAFKSEEGDRATGGLIFREKGCLSCHGAPDTAAPELADSDAAVDPMILAAAMWNHAPQMHELMAERSVAWPRFDVGEMGHLAAYLRDVATARRRERE